MQNAESRMRTVQWHLTLAVVLLLPAFSAGANELSVDHRTIRIGESVTITIALEGAFAEAGRVTPPLRNLSIEGEPSVSSEFSWINGAVKRRKVFRFTAVPIAAGPAIVGPVILEGEGGQRDTLPAIAVQVQPDYAASSNDPATILKELLAEGREPFFAVVEVEHPTAYVGEEVVVTWMVYSAAQVQRWQIARMPKLEDFWVEDLDVSREEPVQVVVAGTVMQRVPARRVALFPLRSGRLPIGAMQIEAAVMRRIDDSPFGLFEGEVEDVMMPSSPGTIDARPLPATAAKAVVGDVVLTCTPPAQKGGGPVVITATMSGRANLRAARQPELSGPIAGDLEVQPLAVTVQRGRDGATMTRSWRYVVFPEKDGILTVPPLVQMVFDPVRGVTSELRCGGAAIAVRKAEQKAELQPKKTPATTIPLSRGDLALRIAAFLIAIAGIASGAAFFRRSRGRERAVRELVAGRTPAEVRESVDAMLAKRGIDAHALTTEASERGDAYRAFRSLADAVERDRVLHGGAGAGELRERVRDLLQSIA